MLSIKKELFQYQVDRHVYVNEEEGKEKITHVQFYNEKSYRAKVVKVETDENGVRSAVIPSVFLKQPYSIMAVGCQRPEETDSQKDYIIITRKSFRVIEQPKPEDYEYLGDQQVEKTPYTTLIKQRAKKFKDKDDRPRRIIIRCHNLVPGKKYKICLEVKSRYRGVHHGEWYHPSDYGNETDPKKCYGYAAWRETCGQGDSYVQEIPEFMKDSDGFVQTEWIVSEKNCEQIIVPEEAFKCLLKPTPQKNWKGILGVQNNGNSSNDDNGKNSLMLRFTIFEEDQEWFLSKNRTLNVLKIGRKGDNPFGYVSVI